MQPDISKYRHRFDGLDLGPEQKDEMLRALWRILENFRDRASGIDSVQISQIARERSSGNEVDAIEYGGNSIAHSFAHVADNETKKGDSA